MMYHGLCVCILLETARLQRRPATLASFIADVKFADAVIEKPVAKVLNVELEVESDAVLEADIAVEQPVADVVNTELDIVRDAIIEQPVAEVLNTEFEMEYDAVLEADTAVADVITDVEIEHDAIVEQPVAEVLNAEFEMESDAVLEADTAVEQPVADVVLAFIENESNVAIEQDIANVVTTDCELTADVHTDVADSSPLDDSIDDEDYCPPSSNSTDDESSDESSDKSESDGLGKTGPLDIHGSYLYMCNDSDCCTGLQSYTCIFVVIDALLPLFTLPINVDMCKIQ